MIRSAIYVPTTFAKSFEPKPHACMLRILDPGAEIVALESTDFVAVASVTFSDITSAEYKGILVSDSHVTVIKEFAESIEKMPLDVDFMVHCLDGRSRSAAIAQWISEHYNVPILGRPTNVGTKLANTYLLDKLRGN